MRVPGHVMLYTLMLLLLVGSLLGMYVWHYALQGRWLHRQQSAEIAERTLLAGLYTHLSADCCREGRYSYEIEGAEVMVRSRAWGLWQLVRGKLDTSLRTALVGELALPVRSHSLWVQDQRSALALSGHAQLSGTLYLPSAGLRTAYIDQRGFEGEALYQGSKQASPAQPPGFDPLRLNMLFPILSALQHQPTNGERKLLTDTDLDIPWEEEPYEIQSQGSLILGKVRMQGPIQIRVRDTLWISPEAELEHTLLLARHVVVRPGFSGRVQIFATGSITLEGNAVCAYPSGLVLAPPPREPGRLLLQDQSQVEGYLIASRQVFPGNPPHRNDLVQIGPKAQLLGSLDTELPLDLRGHLSGSANVQTLVVALPARIYKHALLDGRFDPSALADQFVGPLTYGSSLKRVLRWLE